MHNQLYIQFHKFPDSVIAGVTTRHGGVSEGPYATLNMSYFLGDREDNVRENRKRLSDAAHMNLARMTGAVQVHKTNIAVVTEELAGSGALSGDTAIPDTDGLVTDLSDTPLTLLFADCTPLLFYDPAHHVIGAAHGGWRGTAGNIGGKMVSLMEEKWRTNPEDIVAGIGPAIGPDSFEVGEEVEEVFRNLFREENIPWNGSYSRKGNPGKAYLDLPLINKELLIKAGVREENIEMAGIDTMTSPDFFSYRRDKGKCGRHMAFIAMK